MEVLFDTASRELDNGGMTVCVAAIAENGKKMVLASDNMLTVAIGTSIQYQQEDTDHKKIYELNTNVFALTAGATSIADMVISEARGKITQGQKPATVSSVLENADKKLPNLMLCLTLSARHFFIITGEMALSFLVPQNNPLNRRLQHYAWRLPLLS